VRGDEGDVLDPIVRRQRFGVLEDFRVVDGVNLAGALAGGERGQNSGARPRSITRAPGRMWRAIAAW